VRARRALVPDDHHFDPTTPKGTPGQTVTLGNRNEGSVEHDFAVEEQEVDEDIEPAIGHGKVTSSRRCRRARRSGCRSPRCG
jgi:hypothetical protein